MSTPSAMSTPAPMSAPWLVRTETTAQRLGDCVTITTTAVPAPPDAHVAAFAAEHLRELDAQHPDLRVGPLEAVALPAGEAVLRFGTCSHPSGELRLAAVYRIARGMLQGVTATGPVGVEELITRILDWVLEDGSVHLTVTEFRLLERIAGAQEASFVRRSRLVETGDLEPDGALDAVARGLALRGVVMRDPETVGWMLTPGVGAIVAPLLGARQLVWATRAIGAEADGATAAIVFARTGGAWSAMQDEWGGLRVTALDAVDPVGFAADWCGFRATARAGTPPVAGSLRFVRPAGDGLEMRELAWRREEDGTIRRIEDGQADAVDADGASLVAALTDGFCPADGCRAEEDPR